MAPNDHFNVLSLKWALGFPILFQELSSDCFFARKHCRIIINERGGWCRGEGGERGEEERTARFQE